MLPVTEDNKSWKSSQRYIPRVEPVVLFEMMLRQTIAARFMYLRRYVRDCIEVENLWQKQEETVSFIFFLKSKYVKEEIFFRKVSFE